MSSLAQIAQRHQSFDPARTEGARTAHDSYVDDSYLLEATRRNANPRQPPNMKNTSPGPGQYLGMYENSAFKHKVDPKDQEILSKKQEFGSQRPRFNGPEE